MSPGTYRSRIYRADYLPERVRRYICKRQPILCPVKDIKELAAKLQLHVFCEWKVFRKAKVSLPEIRPARDVARGVAVPGTRYQSKGCRIDPLADLAVARRCQRGAPE
jgi:hypothetical protein